jgi:hypothetical protein
MERAFSRPADAVIGGTPQSCKDFQSDRQAAADQLQGAADRAPGRERPRAHGIAHGRPRRSSVAANVSPASPASPPRSRAVWDGRRPLQPPLRRPGAGAWQGGRSASGSEGTVSLRSRTTAVLRGFRGLLARPQETAPEGEDAGMGPATPLGSERD